MLTLMKSYAENTEGRDFICADVHGHFNLLEAEMEKVEFDKTKDRLFSLGDLIDRGKDSFATLEWLQQPWFHAVIGNHESMFMQNMDRREESPERFENWWKTPGDWRESLSLEELKELYAALCKLPMVMELTLPQQRKVGLCHAQFPDPCDWLEFKPRLENNDYDYLAEIWDCLIWRSDQFKYAKFDIEEPRPAMNIDHVFHGHNIVDEITTYGNRTFMDLGSYNNGRVGFIEPSSFLANLAAKAIK